MGRFRHIVDGLLWGAAFVAAATEVLDFSTPGVPFEGVGALSGGGGDSRLLIDYPEPIQQDILDALFLPNRGASLQYIKVEIGGDAQSTEGVEQSHEHYRGDLNCTRGYEWYIMSEAKKRNPAIKTFGLSWGVPGWIGNGNYFSADNLKYHVDWVYCAEQYWGIHIDYMGIWNERNYEATWIKQLRSALDDAGYVSTRIVAADGGWESIVSDMMADPELAAAIDVVGAHYPGTAPPVNRTVLDKSFWASEMWNLGVTDDWGGAVALANDLQRHATYGLSSSIVWCLIYSWYANANYGHFNGQNSGSGHSLMTASEPWSGYYEVSPPMQVIGHWTQFAKRGWNYLTNGAGISSLPGGGGYTTVFNTHVPANVLEFSVIITTMDATAAQSATFQIANIGTATMPAALHVWRSGNGTAMVQQPDVTVASDGTFTLSLDPACMYSVTTTTGQGWVQPANAIPNSQPFPFPHSDAFDTYADGAYARYFSDMGGVWVVNTLPADLQRAKQSAQAAGAQTGATDKALHQVVPMPPIAWAANPNPFTFVGNPNPNTYPGLASWTDYTVTATGAFDAVNGGSNELTVQEVCSASAATQSFSLIGGDLFTTPAYIQSTAYSGMCLGKLGADPAYGGAIYLGLTPCNGSVAAYPPQQWSYNATSSQVFSPSDGLCIDVLSQSTSVGASTIAWPCETPAGPNEAWTINKAAGNTFSIVSKQTGYCLDLSAGAAAQAFLWLTTRLNNAGWNPPPNGYSLYLHSSANATTPGTWALQYASKVLASGAVSFAVVPSTWYTLSLTTAGKNITAAINGQVLTTISDSSIAFGNVAVGSGWHSAWWDNFAVTA